MIENNDLQKPKTRTIVKVKVIGERILFKYSEGDLYKDTIKIHIEPIKNNYYEITTINDENYDYEENVKLIMQEISYNKNLFENMLNKGFIGMKMIFYFDYIQKKWILFSFSI